MTDTPIYVSDEHETNDDRIETYRTERDTVVLSDLSDTDQWLESDMAIPLSETV
jgi:hypothetical protein